MAWCLVNHRNDFTFTFSKILLTVQTSITLRSPYKVYLRCCDSTFISFTCSPNQLE